MRALVLGPLQVQAPSEARGCELEVEWRGFIVAVAVLLYAAPGCSNAGLRLVRVQKRSDDFAPVASKCSAFDTCMYSTY